MNTQLVIKVLINAVMITAISELSKRSSSFAAILAALPLTSTLAFIWIYIDTKDSSQVANLSTGIFWAVIPSLLFFLALPLLLKWGMQFWPAMIASVALLTGVYYAYVKILGKLGITF